MSHAMTAKQLLDALQDLPATERGQLFLLLGGQAFKDDNFTHERVFGHLATETLTAKEAAESLEMSVPNPHSNRGTQPDVLDPPIASIHAP